MQIQRFTPTSYKSKLPRPSTVGRAALGGSLIGIPALTSPVAQAIPGLIPKVILAGAASGAVGATVASLVENKTAAIATAAAVTTAIGGAIGYAVGGGDAALAFGFLTGATGSIGAAVAKFTD